MSKFHDSITHLSADALVRYGLVQLERTNCHRAILEKRVAWERGFPVQGARDEISLTNRVVSFIVEEVLAHPPSGTAQVKESDWIDVMSIADLCIESCFRSDSLHQRLTSSSVELTDLYEIRTLPDADQTDVDLNAYNTYRRQSTLPNSIPINIEIDPQKRPRPSPRNRFCRKSRN